MEAVPTSRRRASLFALVAIGFGGGLWWTWQRSIRVDAANREASATLLEASQLLSRARSASGEDLTPWLELTQWSKRAEALLDRPELGSESRREIQELVETVVRERDRAEAISRDRRTIQRFSTIHADMALDLNYIRADREFAKVFHDYGIDVDLLPPEEAGARIALAPIAVELVNALDQWTFIRRVLSRGSTPGSRYLSAVAQSADPDPWRCRLRDALEMESTNREGARAIYEELATTASQKTLHRESLSRLAYALGQFGKKEKETATTLLRQAQRSHPDDFWINYDLARSLMGTGRADDAARYFTAAVAIRPRSALALRSLREALREAGHAE